MAVQAPPLPLSDSERLRTALEIGQRWELRDRQLRLLISVPERTFYHWKAGKVHLSADQRARISHLANIDIAIEAIFTNSGVARRWLQQPNAAFGGRPPLSVMLENGFAGILRVRSYLSRLL